MYQCKVDVDMLNTVKSVLADILSVSPSSELILSLIALCSDEGLMLETSANTLYTVQQIVHIVPHLILTLIHCMFYRYAGADQN